MLFNSKLTYFNLFYNEILNENTKNNNDYSITIKNENSNIKNNFFIEKITKKLLGKNLTNYLYLYLLNQNTINHPPTDLLNEFFFVIPINMYLELSNEKNFGAGYYYKKHKKYLDTLQIKKNKLIIKLDVKQYQTENLINYQINENLLDFNNLLKDENKYMKILIEEILKIKKKRKFNIFQIANKYHANSLEKNLNFIFELKNKNDYLDNKEFKEIFLLEHILNKNFHLLLLEEITGINSYYWYIVLFLITKKVYKKIKKTELEFEEIYFKILNLLIEVFTTVENDGYELNINNNFDLFIINLIEINLLFVNFYDILIDKNHILDNTKNNISEKKLLQQQTINNILKNKENLSEILVFSYSYKEYLLKYYLTTLIKNISKLNITLLNNYREYIKQIPNMNLNEVIKVLSEITVCDKKEQEIIEKKLKNFKVKEKLILNNTYEFYFNPKYQNKSELYYIFDKITEYIENNREEEIARFFYKIFH